MNVTDRILGESDTPEQLAQRAQRVLDWITTHKRRVPSAEATMASRPDWAFKYAIYAINGEKPRSERVRWDGPHAAMAEKSIATSAYWSLQYAYHVVCGRWPDGEEALKKSPSDAYIYAITTLKKRWPEGEASIAQSEWKDKYLEEFPGAKDDWIIKGWLDWLDT